MKISGISKILGSVGLVALLSSSSFGASLKGIELNENLDTACDKLRAIYKDNKKVKITFKRANQSGTYEEKTVTVTLGKKSDFSDVTTDNSSDSSNDSNNNSNNGNNNGNSNGNSGNSNGNSGDYGYGNGNFGNDNGNGYINPYEYFFGNNY